MGRCVFIFVQEAVKCLGGMDTLILNHANIGKMMIWLGDKENLEVFDNLVKVNFCSYVHLASKALPHLMQSKQGRLGIMSSIAGVYNNNYTHNCTHCKLSSFQHKTLTQLLL